MEGQRPPRLLLAGPGATVAGALAALVGRDRHRFDFDPLAELAERFRDLPSIVLDVGDRFAQLGPLLRDPLWDRSRSADRFHMQGRPRGHTPHRYKGSAMAKRATRRGGNPARSGLARLAP